MASDHIKLEIAETQSREASGYCHDTQQADRHIQTLELQGNRLRIDGWSDGGRLPWVAEVELTDTQLQALRGQPMGDEPVAPISSD